MRISVLTFIPKTQKLWKPKGKLRKTQIWKLLKLRNATVQKLSVKRIIVNALKLVEPVLPNAHVLSVVTMRQPDQLYLKETLGQAVNARKAIAKKTTVNAIVQAKNAPNNVGALIAIIWKKLQLKIFLRKNILKKIFYSLIPIEYQTKK